MNKLLATFWVGAFLCGCSLLPLPDKHVTFGHATPDAFPKMVATGFAIIDKQPGKDKNEQLLYAMRASKLDAYRELAEQVHGTMIQSRTSVQKWQINNEEVVVTVNGMVKGAKVVKSYALDNHYITEVSLDYQTLWHMQQNEKPRKVVAEIEYF